MVQQILKDQDNSRKYRLRLVLTTFVDFRKVLVQKVIQMIQATVALLTIKHEGILLHCVKYARIRFSLTWVKRANLKTYVTRKQSTPNFLEKTISYPMIRKRICAYQGVKMFAFRKIWIAFFSRYLRFAIRSFALLPTSYAVKHMTLSFKFIVNKATVVWIIRITFWIGTFWKSANGITTSLSGSFQLLPWSFKMCCILAYFAQCCSMKLNYELKFLIIHLSLL